ncbi:hypothetical protein [Citricoccus sp.]|uniref:hypothetical protein n=1 Tax=Citricoccus sp. TaxID=1978372 RepID=UPI0028BE0346|nr:hypothetical protein [Citricoccus sp.]
MIDALCDSDRPESITVWKRSATVHTLLRELGEETIPVTREGLDTVPGKTREHLRALLQHHRLLPQRDVYLRRFEQWITAKLDGLPDEVRQPVQHFATWHHATFPTNIFDDGDTGTSISLGAHLTDVSEPFASRVRVHLAARPDLRTGAGPESSWLFSSTLADRHLHPNSVMDRLRDLGINLLGARHRAIGELVLGCPPSLVAEILGYSTQVAFLHASKAAEPSAGYAGRSVRSP